MEQKYILTVKLVEIENVIVKYSKLQSEKQVIFPVSIYYASAIRKWANVGIVDT